MTLPPRPPKTRMGVRQDSWVFPRHERFVRTHTCSVPGCHSKPIHLAHVRSADNSGVGMKPPSWFTISLCMYHHAEQHQIGQPAFEQKYQIDLFALAAEFASMSPDLAMKEAMKSANDAR